MNRVGNQPIDAAAERLVRGHRRIKHANGAEVIIEPPAVFMGSFQFDSPTRVGAFTYFHDGSAVRMKSIGRYCSIADQVTIGDYEHPVEWLSSNPFQYNDQRFSFHPAGRMERVPEEECDFRGTAPVIGNDVWLGARVQVLRGVTIGDGAIAAAGAVVVKDVPPYAIVGGVPAKVIRYRFDEATIERLLRVRWWRFSPAQLEGVPTTDVQAALDEIERRIDAGMEPYEPEPITLPVPRSPAPAAAPPGIMRRIRRAIRPRTRLRKLMARRRAG